MTEQKAQLIIQQLKSEKYLNAMQFLHDEILKIEVKSDPSEKPTSPNKRKIRALRNIIEKISEAAAFGSEWAEGQRAQNAAIVRLLKLSDTKRDPLSKAQTSA